VITTSDKHFTRSDESTSVNDEATAAKTETQGATFYSNFIDQLNQLGKFRGTTLKATTTACCKVFTFEFASDAA
jgi:hypothetical protein